MLERINKIIVDNAVVTEKMVDAETTADTSQTEASATAETEDTQTEESAADSSTEE